MSFFQNMSAETLAISGIIAIAVGFVLGGVILIYSFVSNNPKVKGNRLAYFTIAMLLLIMSGSNLAIFLAITENSHKGWILWPILKFPQ